MMKFWFRRLLVLFALVAIVAGVIYGVLTLRKASTELVFVAGLHNPNTGEEFESVFDVTADDTFILVVNFWASWCPPCIAEAPGLQKAHRYYQASYGTKVMLVGLNVGESDSKVKGFAEKYGLTFPLIGGVSSGQFSGGLPTTVVYRKTDGGWEQVTEREGAVAYHTLADLVDLMYAEMLSGE